jgi:hypothetical protein
MRCGGGCNPLAADVATAPASQAFARRRADPARSFPGVTSALEFSTALSVELGHQPDHADDQRQPANDEDHDSHHDITRVQFPKKGTTEFLDRAEFSWSRFRST